MSKDRLDEHLQNIQSALGGSGEPTSNDKLDWYLSNITSLIEGGGGGGGSGISDVKINNTSVVSDHIANISLKTVNNNSIVGSGDLSIASKHTFPNTWTTNNTTETFCTSIVNDDSAVPGMIYMGKLTCSDLPSGLGQGEASVEIISKDANGKALRIILTSVDTAPYRWEYERAKVNGTYINTGWVSYLPTTGGTVSGDIKFTTNNNGITDSSNNRVLRITGTAVQFGTDSKDINFNSNTTLKHTKNGTSYDVLDTSNGLPLSGGTMTGSISLNGTGRQGFKNKDGYDLFVQDNSWNKVVIGNTISNSSVSFITTSNGSLRYQKGIESGDVLSTLNTSANPTLSGGETVLTSLKLNDTNYTLASGTQVTFVDWS